MINVSKTFRRNLYEGNNKFLMRLVITLQDNTRLEVQNDNIMSNGGILIDDAVSEDDDFTALGSAIINACDVILYNNTNLYSNYEFINAKVVVYVGLQLGENNVEEFKKGTYTVDDAVYGEYTVTLSLVDEMAQFDRPYSESQLAYPATLNSIILNACSICNVPLANSSLQFPHRDFSVPNRPSDESTTFREVIGWVATIAGCFARCNVDGELELKWFDINSLDAEQEAVYDGGTINPWSTGDTVDGGTFNPWSTGDTVDGGEFTDTHNVHYISSLYSQSLGVDDVVITGVRITVEIDDVESDEDTKVFMQGTEGYVIDIADNKFITEDNAATILAWLATLLIGTRFRKCNVQHLTDPTIEAGDIALLWDTKDAEHRILITRVDFSPTRLQTVISGAASVGRNSATRFSSQTKSYVETRRQLREQKDSYEDALERLGERIDNASGLYETDVTQQDSSVIKYYHNKPQLSESDIQIVISDVGITVTSNGTDANPTWYGLTVDGTLITSILNTVGINADWIVTGMIADKTGESYWNLDSGGASFVGDMIMKRQYFEPGKMSQKRGFVQAKIGTNDFYNRPTSSSPYVSTDTGVGFNVENIQNDVTVSRFSVFPIQYGTGTSYSELQLSSSARQYIEDLWVLNLLSGHRLWLAKYLKNNGGNDDGFNIEIRSNAASESFYTPFNCHVTDSIFQIIKSNSYELRLSDTDTGSYYDGIWISAGNHAVTYLRIQPESYIDLDDKSYIYMYGNSYILMNSSANLIIRSTTASISGKTIQFASTSSKRYKENIKSVENSELDPHRLYNLEVKQFRYHDGMILQYDDMAYKEHVGFIAEDVAEIYPDAVIHDVETGQIESWDERRILPPMLKLIQEQKAKIDELETRIARLEALLLKEE